MNCDLICWGVFCVGVGLMLLASWNWNATAQRPPRDIEDQY
jgi:hypothetical protein